jgi:hypothetical protein
MKGRSLSPEHWTDEQLIEHLYGIGPVAASKEGAHMEACEECRGRLAAMQLSRSRVETRGSKEELSLEALLVQRRAIYRKLEGHAGWRTTLRFQKWAPAACALLVLCGGFAVWEHRTAWPQQSQEQVERANISDEQLVEEASQVANDVAPDAAAPLRALFED